MTLRAAALPIRGSKSPAKRRVVRKRAPRAKADKPTPVAPGKPLVKRTSKRATGDFTDATVLIDDRAGSKELVDYPPFDQCGVLSRLDSGDAFFIGNGPNGQVKVGVELKSVYDLLSATDNGRIQGTQLPAMIREYDVVWLLWYGRVRQAPYSNQLQIYKSGEWRNYYLGKRPVPYGMLTGFLIGLQEIGVNCMRVEDKREAADWLAELVRWRSKPWAKHKSMRVLDQSRPMRRGKAGEETPANDKRANRASLMPVLDDRLTMMATVAAGLPSLGYERAVAAAEHFKDVVDMVNAPADVWAELTTLDRATGKQRKFGKGVGDAVYRALRWRRSSK